MGNLGILFLIMLWLFIASCGRQLPVATRPVIEFNQQVQTAGLEGLLQLVATETDFDLRDLSERPSVVIFAADTCSTCREEAQELVDLFAEKQGIPANIHFYTVIVGGFIEDARDWSADLAISWPVAIDLHQDQVFKRYCPEQQTPCVLVYNPSTNQLFKHIGKSSYLDWQKETGAWLY